MTFIITKNGSFKDQKISKKTLKENYIAVSKVGNKKVYQKAEQVRTYTPRKIKPRKVSSSIIIQKNKKRIPKKEKIKKIQEPQEAEEESKEEEEQYEEEQYEEEYEEEEEQYEEEDKNIKNPLFSKRMRKQAVLNMRGNEDPYYASIRAITLDPSITYGGLKIVVMDFYRKFKRDYDLDSLRERGWGYSDQEIPNGTDKSLDDGRIHVVFQIKKETPVNFII